MALDFADAGHQAPLPGKTVLRRRAGRTRFAARRHLPISSKVGFFSAHDATIGRELATVICGGDLSAPQWVDKEEYFPSASNGKHSCGSCKTTKRRSESALMPLETGKPLRN